MAPPKIKLPQLPFLTREMLKYGSTKPMRLRLSAASDIAAEILMRGITRNGVINHGVNTSADGLINADVIGIDDFPIWVSAVDEGDNFLPGQCWANISLELSEKETISLASGFVHQDKGIMWPSASHIDVMPGRGFITDVATTNPTAGVELTITVPDGEIWRLLQFSTVLVADATSISRRPHWRVTQPGGTETEFWTPGDQTANQTIPYFGQNAAGNFNNSNANHMMVPIPDQLFLGPAATFVSDTINFQAGDNWEAMNMRVEKFFSQG